MSNEEKMEYIAESLEMEVEELTPDTVLEDLETWDSVAVLSVISIINENFGRYPNAKEILSYKTVGDLMAVFEECND